MKVKILKPFADKYDRSIRYRVGDTVEMTAGRVEEANSTWRGQLVAILSNGEEKPKAKPGRKPKAEEE